MALRECPVKGHESRAGISSKPDEVAVGDVSMAMSRGQVCVSIRQRVWPERAPRMHPDADRTTLAVVADSPMRSRNRISAPSTFGQTAKSPASANQVLAGSWCSCSATVSAISTLASSKQTRSLVVQCRRYVVGVEGPTDGEDRKSGALVRRKHDRRLELSEARVAKSAITVESERFCWAAISRARRSSNRHAARKGDRMDPWCRGAGSECPKRDTVSMASDLAAEAEATEFASTPPPSRTARRQGVGCGPRARR